MYPTLAGDRDATFGRPRQLFAGDSQLITNSAVALADIAQHQVCVLTATGVKPYVVADDGAKVPDKLVIAQVPVLAGQDCPLWIAGSFNHEALIWPAGVATYAARRELVLGSHIQIGHLLG